MESNILQFQPLNSTLNVSFWYELSRQKLEKLKLSEAAVGLKAVYSTSSTGYGSNQIHLEAEGFQQQNKGPIHELIMEGKLYNTNTIESFKEKDKKKLFDETSNQILNDIQSERVLEDSSLFNKFVLFTFADLKKYIFYYWFAFPALCCEPVIQQKSSTPFSQEFSSEQVNLK